MGSNSLQLRQLAKYIAPYTLAKVGAKEKGYVPLGNLDRLADLLVEKDTNNVVDVLITCCLDDCYRTTIVGNLNATLSMCCQRCLDVVGVNLSSRLNLTVVKTEERMRCLPKEKESIIVEDDRVNLWRLIEDELLLSLPLAPCHELIHCYAKQTYSTKL